MDEFERRLVFQNGHPEPKIIKVNLPKKRNLGKRIQKGVRRVEKGFNYVESHFNNPVSWDSGFGISVNKPSPARPKRRTKSWEEVLFG